MVSQGNLQKIDMLWEQMTEFGASDVDLALKHLLTELAQLLDADNIAWVGSAQISNGKKAQGDPLGGWRVVLVRDLHSDPERMAVAMRAMQEQDSQPGHTTLALVEQVGQFRVHRLRDKGFIDLEAYEQTPQYTYLHKAFDIRDRMYVGVPINQQTESYFLIDRCGRDEPFSQESVTLVNEVMRGLKWFQKELMLAYGLGIASENLSPMERRIVQFLLTDLTEKEIADKLQHSYHTTHTHVKSIYRKYGVRGRSGLMSLWLSRQF